ncbi:MAG: hypothetical protein ABGY41_15085, partial [Candidatus Poribacteria bacterium]
MLTPRLRVAALALFLLGSLPAARGEYRVTSPAGDLPTRIDHARGSAILPNGRVVKPHGSYVFTAPHPYGLALTSD